MSCSSRFRAESDPVHCEISSSVFCADGSPGRQRACQRDVSPKNEAIVATGAVHRFQGIHHSKEESICLWPTGQFGDEGISA